MNIIKFKEYKGDGVCDVCGNSLAGVKAYIVDNHIFYSSRGYKDYLANIPIYQLLGVEKTIQRMKSQDISVTSAICEDCIHLF